MKVLKRDQIISCEKRAMEKGISEITLMKNAGKAAAQEIIKRYDITGKKITVLTGTGNNGGDGFVIADILARANAKVEIVMPLGEPKTETAKEVYPLCEGIEKAEYIDGQSDIIIDALFGTGLNRDMPKEVCELIDTANEMDAKRIAIDIPSGVFCDGGVSSCAFNADLVLTMIAAKPCFFLPPSNEYCKEIKVLDIGVQTGEYAYQTIEPPLKKIRRKNAHKGDFGKALLICGSYGMCGAQILSVSGALKSGAGLVKTFVCDKNYAPVCTSAPEAVTIPVKTRKNGSMNISKKELLKQIKGASAILVGCGLGQTRQAKQTVFTCLENATCPIVLDADGINAICGDISIIRRSKASMILTPHPAEMARLCKKSVAEVERDRANTALDFAMQNGCTIVLKGANTVVAAPDGSVYFNTTGNAGMATGGSGDVLAGITVGLLAQGESPQTAARNAVWLHGNAGDEAARLKGQSSMLPSDIIDLLLLP